MTQNSAIEWCTHTWNPWMGCRHVSSGCANCYMFTEMRRYGRDPAVITRTKTWKDPAKWNRKAEASGVQERVFTCSWSDFFIEEADNWRDEAWSVIAACPSLDFQVLTKRPERISGHLPAVTTTLPLPNVWIGVSVENRNQGLPRIDILREIPAAVRFLSVEPLLEDLGPLNLRGIHWVIGGGESGHGARPMHPDWIRGVRDHCMEQNVPFFMKQWGNSCVPDQMPEETRRQLDASGDLLYTDPDDGQPWAVGKNRAGRELDGLTWDEYPEPSVDAEQAARMAAMGPLFQR